jgi:hypothetical protein
MFSERLVVTMLKLPKSASPKAHQSFDIDQSGRLAFRYAFIKYPLARERSHPGAPLLSATNALWKPHATQIKSNSLRSHDAFHDCRGGSSG